MLRTGEALKCSRFFPRYKNILSHLVQFSFRTNTHVFELVLVEVEFVRKGLASESAFIRSLVEA